MSNLLGLNQVLHDFIENRRTELATAPGFHFFVPLIITGGAEGDEDVLGKGMVLANFRARLVHDGDLFHDSEVLFRAICSLDNDLFQANGQIGRFLDVSGANTGKGDLQGRVPAD